MAEGRLLLGKGHCLRRRGRFSSTDQQQRLSMSVNRTQAIRQTIRSTKSEPSHQEALLALIGEQMPKLHTSIHLPSKNPAGALVDFIIRYIEHVPNFIDAIGGLTRAAGIYEYSSIFLTMAEDFFVNPPAVLQKKHGLNALMAEAYLAHRLIEEVNDRILSHCGIPLAPMDMTRSNLIVHELLGEPYANELDFIVFYATETHMSRESSMNNAAFHQYVEAHKQHGWKAELDKWPCLAEDLSISLSFEQTADGESVAVPVSRVVH